MINKDIVIIGAGPAGMSAALYLARTKYSFVLIEKATPGGKLNITTQLDNYPGVPNTDGFTLTMLMKKQLENLNVAIERDEIKNIEKIDGICKVFGEKEEYNSKAIIIATGSSNKKINVKNEDSLLGKGISYCAVCDGFFYRNKDVMVFANERKAYLEALYLTNLVSKLYLISDKYEDDLENNLDKLIKKENVELLYPYRIIEYRGIDNLDSVVIKNIDTEETKEIKVSGCFPLIGDVPASYIINKLNIETNKGYIVVDVDMRTNIEGIFAAGDIIDKSLRQVVTACSDGAIAATSAIKYLNNLK